MHHPSRDPPCKSGVATILDGCKQSKSVEGVWKGLIGMVSVRKDGEPPRWNPGGVGRVRS